MNLKPRYRIKQWIKTTNGNFIDFPWAEHPLTLKYSDGQRGRVWYFEMVTRDNISWGILREVK